MPEGPGSTGFSHGELWALTVSPVLFGTCDVAVNCHSKRLPHGKLRLVPAEASIAAEHFEMRLGRSLHVPTFPECGAFFLVPSPSVRSFPRNPFYLLPSDPLSRV